MTPRLAPLVPRLAIEWLRDHPQERHRELEGTLLFADVSGFTRLSEKLARRGRVGSEELVAIINACFAGLLEVAHNDGGGLLKFGGDALLLYLEGPDHAARACRAAWRMRKTLRQLVAHPPFPGFPDLRVSMGLHSGLFHFFLVGETHRELIVTGPGATQTVACESAADAGEILISEATARSLDSWARGPRKEPGYLLAGEPPGGPPMGIDAGPLDSLDLDLRPLLPVALRGHLLAGVEEAEHRAAGLAFIRFGGVEAILAQHGPAVLTDALDELVSVSQRAVEQEGITFLETDIDRDGGKIYLVAGAPSASDRDEEKLLRAVRAIADSGQRLPLRIGVHRGHVFTGVVGGAFRRTYSVMGDPVNLAARLTGRAEIGEIIATPAILDRSPSIFATDLLEPFTVKGKKDPIVALRIGRAQETRRAKANASLPLVGREVEMAMLRASLNAARAGGGSLIEITGEPGLGKSRLVEELRAAAADLPTLAVQCAPYTASTPYFAFRELLRTVAAIDISDDPATMTEGLRSRLEPVAPELIPWIPLIAVPMDVQVLPTREASEIDPVFRRTRSHKAVQAFLTRLMRGPALFIFEDTHWMDEGSADLLRGLARELGSRSWLVLTTRRPELSGFTVTPPVAGTTLQLKPLTPDAAEKLAGAAAESLSERDLRVVAERSAGNPLFLRELITARTEGGRTDTLPESVQAVIAARIDRLTAGDRAILRYASVLGPSFENQLMRVSLDGTSEMVQDPTTWERLSEFIEVDLEGRYRFRHALFREVAYEGLSYARRRELHRRVGQIYEITYGHRLQDYTELLSLHFALGGVHDKAWTYSLTAGDDARTKYANVEAADFYQRAIEAARAAAGIDSREVQRVWEALGDVCDLSGSYARAEAAYGAARALASRQAGVAVRLTRKIGLVRDRQGKYTDAMRWYGRAIRSLPSVEPEADRSTEGIQLSLACAGVRYRQGRFTESINWADRAREAAEAIGNRACTAHAYYLLHLAHTWMGSPRRAEYRDRALPIFEELGDLVGMGNVLSNLGIDAYFEGRWDDALKLYARSQQVRERIGDARGAVIDVNNIAEVLSDQGHLEEAETLFRKARSMAAGFTLAPVVATGNLGRSAARGGRFEEADQLLNDALAGFQQLKAESFILETEARLAELAVFRGDPLTALSQANATLVKAARVGGMAALEAMLNRVRGWALMQEGKLAAAEEAIAESMKTGERAGAQYEVGLTLLAQAALADLRGARADSVVARGQAILDRLGVVRTPLIPLPVTFRP